MNRIMIFRVVSLLWIFGPAFPALAIDRPALQVGISMGEVHARWGEPSERIEKESQRRELWVYPSGNVSFLQGYLVDYPGLSNMSTAGQVPDLAREISSKKTPALSGKMPVGEALAPKEQLGESLQEDRSSSDIIGEVLREIPSGEEDKLAPRRIEGAAVRVPLRPTPSNLLPPMDPSVVEDSSNDELP